MATGKNTYAVVLIMSQPVGFDEAGLSVCKYQLHLDIIDATCCQQAQIRCKQHFEEIASLASPEWAIEEYDAEVITRNEFHDHREHLALLAERDGIFGVSMFVVVTLILHEARYELHFSTIAARDELSAETVSLIALSRQGISPIAIRAKEIPRSLFPKN